MNETKFVPKLRTTKATRGGGKFGKSCLEHGKNDATQCARCPGTRVISGCELTTCVLGREPRPMARAESTVNC